MKYYKLWIMLRQLKGVAENSDAVEVTDGQNGLELSSSLHYYMTFDIVIAVMRELVPGQREAVW